ncbi:MAG: hypothetical protein B6I25_01170 [Planctomycetales bacterium 4572_13]|nr:MAG: hypothetical protein B6I25_01170 [Planctomycetales bacterium 4572_13]
MKPSKPDIKSHRLGFGVGLLLNLFSRKPRPHSTTELYKKDFHPNTQKMGLHFSDRVRKVFRLRWLRLK